MTRVRRPTISDPPRHVSHDLPLGAAAVLAQIGALRRRARRHVARKYGVSADEYGMACIAYAQQQELIGEGLRGIDGFLGRGIGRAAFLLPKGVVLKVAIDDESRPMNQSEARIWRHASREDAQYLLPVLAVDVDGWWVAMPRCGRVWSSDELDRRALSRMFDLVGLGDVFTPENWCRYQGRLVLLDYGVP